MSIQILLALIAVELGAVIFLMTRIGWQADQQRRDIWFQLTEIWKAVREQ